MQRLSLLLIAVVLSHITVGQKLLSRNGKATFFSDAAIEDITATTTRATGIIDLSKLEFAFSVTIKDFEFEKSLMKEHFNEKYMESDKYPKATFLGTIKNFDPQLAQQEVIAAGKLTIHGVTRDVSIPASMVKDKSGYNVKAKFIVRLEHHNIQIPQLLFRNIAEEVEVTAIFEFLPQ